MAFTTSLIISTTTEQHEELIYKEAVSLTENHAAHFDADMRANMAIARGIASSMKGYRQGDREIVNGIIKQTLVDNPNILGAYAGFEPNAFDLNDSAYANTKFHDETGRVLPYWNRIGGEIFLEPLVHYDSLDYYQLPKERKMDVLTEPYFYQGEFIVSYVSPIMIDGEFIGIGGADVSLNYIDEEISKIKILDSGYAFTVSNTGLFISHPVKEWIGSKTLYDFEEPEILKMAKDIENGKEGHIEMIDHVTDKEAIVFYEPVRTGNFSMLVVVPKEEMYAGVTAMQNILVAISATAILFMGTIAVFSAQRITKPIKNIVDDFKDISDTALKGSFNKRANTDIEVDFKDIPEGLNDILDALQRSNELNDELKKVVESSPVIVFKWKAQEGWPVEIISDNISNFGYEAHEFIEGHLNYDDIIHPDSKRNVEVEFQKLYNGDSHSVNLEYKIITGDGESRWVNERTTVLHDSEGNVDHLRGLIIDITDKRNAEDAMINLMMEADAANKSKSDFVANMSHELRTPLNAIIGFSDLLKTEMFGKLNEKQTKYVGNVLISGKHLLTLINNVLDISKIEAGKMHLRSEDFELNEMIEDTTSILLPLANKKRINLSHNITDNVITTNADKTMFKQIMYNLVSNAIKFTPEEGNVTINAWSMNKKLYVNVEDTGTGISKNHLDEVFKPFIQVGDFATKEQEGTGLGLALVKKLVELHGGEIWVESEMNEGSTFTFTIPVNK
ncbi:MAG: PAS domain-containing protein [Methanococcoides sp.]|nr:PAS domain-containing protein [Methanococcoides sp.]